MWDSFESYSSVYPKGYTKLSGMCYELNKHGNETIKIQDIFNWFYSASQTGQGILNLLNI